uniref:Putative secreted protein n=1 Tax=Anopheles darlingi TaxID=43151 RepID=A0A2M4DGR5_ANODA
MAWRQESAFESSFSFSFSCSLLFLFLWPPPSCHAIDAVDNRAREIEAQREGARERERERKNITRRRSAKDARDTRHKGTSERQTQR